MSANRIARRIALASCSAIALLGTVSAPASATDSLQLTNLEVSGGEDDWHPVNDFHLSWTGPRGAGAPTVLASHYRIRTRWGEVLVADTRTAGSAESIDGVKVPQAPGEYFVDVWLEDAGHQGPMAQATLRFDDVRPQTAVPLPDSGWINRAEVPFALHIGHPANPLPASGIKGYAVSIDRQPTTEPCASPTLCAEAETDLQGGIGNDSFPVFDLPEGVSYAHAVAVSESGMRSAQAGHAMLRVDKTDPVTSLSGVPAGWTSQPVVLTVGASDALSGMAPGGGGAEPFTALRIDGGAPVISVGDSASAAITAEGVHSVAYYARDVAGNVDDGEGPDMPPSIATVRVDRTPPAVAFADAQDPADPELIVARVSDPLSGPSSSKGRIEIRRAGSGDRFDSLPTEVTAGTLRARWDSESYPQGAYEIRAVGFDAADNSATASLRGNGTAMTLSNPLKAQSELGAGFGGARQRKLGRYGNGALYSGRLSATRGASVADLPVKIFERFPAGASRPERVTTVRTDAGGAFAINLLPGPSRQVTAIFDGTRTLTRAGAQAARLEVRGSVRMSASSPVAIVGGRAVVFRGSVGAVGANIPPGGKSVQLQFRLRGVPWTEFRTIQTDRRGRFRYAYRFTDNDSRGIRFRFRAFAAPQGEWPYEPAASRPIAVTGR